MLIRIGEQTLVLQLSYERTADCVSRIQKIFRELRARNIPEIVSVRPGLDSIAIEYQEGFAATELLAEMKATVDSLPGLPQALQTYTIPVCYEPPFSRDLERVARSCALSVPEVIELHSSATYDVWMMGFMPGFPYLGELPEALQLPRKAKPDPHIPAGSVAIAEEYCGVYPFDSPGGWHILGRTPIPLMNYRHSQPWTFQYDTRVRFVPVSLQEYQDTLLKGQS